MPKSMINTCCNLYFYYNFIVHGGIRHLEMNVSSQAKSAHVHGGIRHLEMHLMSHSNLTTVHGGIRHLEILHSR